MTDPSTLHNRDAPNKQNALCGGRSAWEVMREHNDFKGKNYLFSYNLVLTSDNKLYMLKLP